MIPALFLLASCCPTVQEPEQPPLPEGVVARLGNRMITDEEYRDYLWFRFGKRAVRDMVTDILVSDEARRYGIEIDEALVRQQVDERVEAARSSPRPISFEEELQRNGQSLQMFQNLVAAEVRRDLYLDALVRATRVVTDERLKQAFEQEYGAQGVKTRLRHLLVMPNVLRAERIQAGARPTDIDMQALRDEARALAEEARQRLVSGESFEQVCAQVSHDRVTRDKGGELPLYDGRLYGPAFRDAVLAMGEGQLSAVIESGAGFHVVELLERRETRFEDVKEQLIQTIQESEPTWQEKQALVQALQGRADLQLW